MQGFDIILRNAVYATLVAFFIEVLISPVFIPFLKKLKLGQYQRNDGPKSHLKKEGTPTMGGIMIIVSLIVTSLFFIKNNPNSIAILIATIGFGIVGFIDDFIKVILRRSKGLTSIQKIVLQTIVSFIFIYYLINYVHIGTDVIIPFTHGMTFDLGIWFYPFLLFVVVGTVNSVNLTDGLDGLASSVTILVCTFFAVITLGTQNFIAPIICAAVGSMLGFLLFNAHPAKIFMGDTGSLALGGLIVSIAIILKMPIFLAIVGIIYVAESLSDILQVASYRIRRKRIFKMAPIHHHFELLGWKETKVVAVFSVVTAIACLIAILAL